MVSKILEKAMTEDDKIEIRQKIIFFVGLSILFITAVIFSIYTLDNFFNFGVGLDLEDWIFLIFSIIAIEQLRKLYFPSANTSQSASASKHFF